MFFWRLLKLANNREVLWCESMPFSYIKRGKFKDRIDVLGFLPIRLSAPEICRSINLVFSDDMTVISVFISLHISALETVSKLS